MWEPILWKAVDRPAAHCDRLGISAPHHIAPAASAGRTLKRLVATGIFFRSSSMKTSLGLKKLLKGGSKREPEDNSSPQSRDVISASGSGHFLPEDVSFEFLQGLAAGGG